MDAKFIFRLCLFIFLIVSISYAQETLSKEEQVEKYFNLATDYYNAGEFDKAIEYYSKVIELDSSHADAYWNRAILYGK